MKYINEYKEEDLYKTSKSDYKTISKNQKDIAQLSLALSYVLFKGKKFRRKSLLDILFLLKSPLYTFTKWEKPSSAQFYSMINFLLMNHYIEKNKISPEKIYFNLSSKGVKEGKKILSTIKISDKLVSNIGTQYLKGYNKGSVIWDGYINTKSFMNDIFEILYGFLNEFDNNKTVIKLIEYILSKKIIMYSEKGFYLNINDRIISKLINDDPESISWLSSVLPKEKLKKYSHLASDWDLFDDEN